MGPNDFSIVKQDQMHQEGVLMELEILNPSNLCCHYFIVNHLNNVGRKFIPYISMDILDIQCHDVHATLCIGRAIHP